jgi:thiosulfate/3-mercaptopyruvate sulfurtransferase
VKLLLAAAAGVGLAALSCVAAAQPRADILVSASALVAEGLDNTLVLHTGAEAAYQAGHIPGAVFVTGADISVTGPEPALLALEMPDPQDLHAKLGALGISDEGLIVVSYSPGQLPAATRIMLTLDAAGLGERARLLDGGQAAWERAGGSLAAEVAEAPGAALTAFEMKQLIVTAADVQAALDSGDIVVVDARAAEFYAGERAGFAGQGRQAALGHVSGAASVPFDSLTAEDGTLKSDAELRQIFAAAGIEPGDRLIVYCHVGQQATAVILAARLLGIEAQLYDGSFQDWSFRELPVEGPGA